LTSDQEAELAALIEAGPAFERDGVVRWRCVDLRQLILTRWNTDVFVRSRASGGEAMHGATSLKPG
jgi:hypothetical protein